MVALTDGDADDDRDFDNVAVGDVESVTVREADCVSGGGDGAGTHLREGQGNGR